MTVMLGQQGHKRGRQRLAVPETRKCSENDMNMSRGIRSQLKGARTGPWRNNFRIRRNKKIGHFTLNKLVPISPQT